MNRELRILANILLATLNLFFWIILPLILLLIPRPIKKFWIRFVLCFVSPLSIWMGSEGCFYLERRYRYNQDKIENIIGIELPEFNVVDYNEREINTHLALGYEMLKTLEFKEIPSQSFYNKLDSLCYLNKGLWRNKEYVSFLDSVIKINEMEWMNYLTEDSIKVKMDSIAKTEMIRNSILPKKYLFDDGYVKLEMVKGSKRAVFSYRDIEFHF